jgi:fructokinase
MMKNSNSLCLNERNLKGDMEKALGREVRMANDANCFALSEAIDGAGKGHDVVFGVILGTGVGGGLVMGGRAREGLHGIAGEWGHNPLDESGPEWFDGQRGPVEAFLCGGGLARLYVEAGGEAEADGQRVVEGLRRGEEAAVEGFERYMDYFGRALSVVLNIVDPDCVVLGGGVSNVDEIYERAPAAVAPYIFNDEVKTPILKNVHGDSSGVRGAALLWPREP